MSASEKLKALDTPLPENLAEWGDEVRRRGAMFLDALPQIVAVVEAAEKGVRWESVTSSIGVEDARVLYATLAALDEALS